MTRTFLLLSTVSSLLLLAGAFQTPTWFGAPVLFVPAALLHMAMLLRFGRTSHPRIKAYFWVIRRPAVLGILFLAAAPFLRFLGEIPGGVAAWAAALFNIASFHVEYQSVRESEFALRNER